MGPFDSWVAIAGLAIAIVGLPFAYLLARRGRRRPTLRYALDFDRLVAPEDGLMNQGLSLTFRGQAISRVSRTYIALWNDKGDTVNRGDVLATDPLRLCFGDGDIPLQTRVVCSSRDQIDLSVRLASDEVTVAFEFLDDGDGGLIEVLHQGTIAPSLVGTVKGARIRGPIRATLTPSAVGWMADPRRLGRIRMRVLGRLTGLTGRRRWLVVMNAVVSLSFIVAFPVFLALSLHDASLVDARKYKLNTIVGQASFASDVHAHSGLDIGFTAGLAAYAVIGMLVIAAILFGGWTVVPRTIMRTSSLAEAEATTQEGK
jgi:hypothetical protein